MSAPRFATLRVAASAATSPSGSMILFGAVGAAGAAALGWTTAAGLATACGLAGVLYRSARQEKRLERIIERSAEATERELHQVRRTQARLEARLDAADAAQATLGTRIEVTQQENEDTRQRIEVLRTDTATRAKNADLSIRASLDQTARSLEAQIAGERSQRIAGVARGISSGSRPDKLVLILATHRTGSTLLLDLIRSIDGVALWHSAEWWDRLGLAGRRYPGDLSDDEDASRELEVQPGVGSLVPELRDRYLVEPIAVEKLHPEFFGYDTAAFAARVGELREALPVEIVYLARQPLDAMWSMVEYKRRNEQWYAHVAEAAVPELIRHSLETMTELHEIVPGAVVDYADLDRASHTLPTILAPVVGTRVELLAQNLERAHDALQREKRPGNSRGVFVGTADAVRTEAGPENQWVDLGTTLTNAATLYSELVNRA